MTDSTGTALPAVEIDGRNFVLPPAIKGGPKQRFIARGVALQSYVPELKDVLRDEHHDYFKATILPCITSLNVNLIRVYEVEPGAKHDKTMLLLAQHGIYVLVGLESSGNSIDRLTGNYHYRLFQRATGIADEFTTYANTFGFSAGNEVVFPGQIQNLSPANPVQIELFDARAVKSFARDVKAYIAANCSRAVPVGVCMQDAPEVSVGPAMIGTDVVGNYYAAGSTAERLDFIGVNTYAYIPGGPMNAYDRFCSEFQDVPVPVLLTETGGEAGSERGWKIVPQMYGATLSAVLSGQIAFQLFDQDPPNLGLYNQSKTNKDGKPVATSLGGVVALAQEFTKAAALPLPALIPAPSAPTTQPPSGYAWLPLAPAFSSPASQVSFQNAAPNGVTVVQGGATLTTIPAASGGVPSSVTLTIAANADLAMLLTSDMSQTVCWVTGPQLQAAVDAAQAAGQQLVVADDVSWGLACSLQPSGQATLVSVTFLNYATEVITVVQAGSAVGTLPAAAAQGQFTSTSMGVSPLLDVNLQYNSGSTWTQVCSVPAAILVEGVTVANNCGWGSVCTITPAS